MTVTASTAQRSPVAPTLAGSARNGVRFVEAGPDLYRVIAKSDRIIGHVQISPHPLGPRYEARRYSAPHSSFISVGEFWSVDDAVSSLRHC